jgi:hypothetical protein
MKFLDESKWFTCDDPTPMMVFLRDKATERKLRLFAVACCRRIWNLIPDKPGHEAVKQAERFADGMISRQRLAKARRACFPRAYLNRPLIERDNAWIAMLAVLCCVSHNRLDLEFSAMASAMAYSGFSLVDAPDRSIAYPERQKLRAQEHRYQASLLREIFVNPFRSVVSGLAESTPAIKSVAGAIYSERAFERMPILGDALEKAGRSSIEVLAHCREPGEHVRGCWLLDELIGKT